MPGQSDDLQLALELADLADSITIARFRASDLVVETKPDMTPVSEADRAVERALRERLAEARPADIVFGEEYGGDGSAVDGRRWIVDPIDGTKGYVRGVPIWATLLALEEAGEVTLGVASAPAMGTRWWATRESGAFRVERGKTREPTRLRVSAVRELSDAQVCYGGIEEWRELGRLERLLDLGSRSWRSRGFGDFYQYMLVAEGAAEVALDVGVSLWDLAAPMVIVEAAGGRFTDLSGAQSAAGGNAIASNGLLHDAARAILDS